MHVEERASPIDGVVTDDALTLEATHGDGPAMAAIFRSYHQPLYRFCLAIVGNPQDAQDALQNTMVMVLRALPGERRHIALKPWLYRIAHNQSIDLLRRRQQSVPLDESAPALGEDLAVRVEMRQRLRQLIVDLDALPQRQREALLMREAADLDFEEIGATLDTTAAAARQTLYEARLSLRQMEAGREMSCGLVTAELSEGDGRARRRRDIRAHLRTCNECRQFVGEIDSRRDALAAIAPLPAVAAAAILRGAIGGGSATATGAGASSGGGLAGLLGGGAAKSLGTATLLKGVAAIALVAAIGVGAADRDGLIHLGHGGPPAAVGTSRGADPTASGADTSAARRPAGTSAGSSPRRREPHRPSASGGAAPVGAHKTIDSSGATQRSPSQPDGTAAAAATPASTTVAGEAPSDPATASSSSAPGAAGPSPEEAAPTSPGKSGDEHPAGKVKHEKQLPAAAAHGQEMAASHGPENAPGHGAEKAGAGNSASSRTETAEPGAEHPAHPVHPTHPAKSATAAEPESTAEPAPVAESSATTEPAATEPEPTTEPAPTEPAGKPPHGKKP
jgi:RNA polymerase sigma factor (sigma-70 family)